MWALIAYMIPQINILFWLVTRISASQMVYMSMIPCLLLYQVGPICEVKSSDTIFSIVFAHAKNMHSSSEFGYQLQAEDMTL